MPVQNFDHLTPEQLYDLVTGRDVDFKELQKKLFPTPYVYGKGTLKLGREATLFNAVVNLACGNVTVGDRSFCGHNVCILTGSHTLDDFHRARAPQGRDIVIGKDVWLASNCTILGPCTIGDRCVVAAGAVVPPRANLEAGWVYAGVPAKKLRPAIDVRAEGGIGPLLLRDLRGKK